MSGVLNLATVGSLDLGKASDIVTDGLTAMGLAASDVGDFTDMMSATITNANTSVELMGETMKYVGPVAGALGIEMEDLSVAIGLMGNAGIKGSQAGTALRGGLTRLIKPTDKSAAAMEEFNIEVKKNEDGTVNLAATIDNLRKNMGGLDASTQAQALATIFGQEAMSGWASIINATDSDLSKLTSAVNGSTKSMQFWKTQMEDAGMSSKNIEKNLLALDKVFEETQLTAKSLGLTSTDLSKVITLLGTDSKVTSKNVNNLLNVFKTLQNPSKDAKKQLSDLGIELVKFDNGSIDVNSSLGSLRNGLKGLSDDQKATVLSTLGLKGSQKELNEILSLSDTEFNDYMTKLEETKGLTEKLAEVMDATTTGSIKSMASALSDLLIEAFKSVKPSIVEFSNIIGEAANILKTQGITAATQYLVDNFREKIKELPRIMGETINTVGDAIIENFPSIMTAAGELVQNFSRGIIENKDKIRDSISVMVKSIATFVTENAPALGEAAITLLRCLSDALKENQQPIKDALNTFTSTATEYLATKKTLFIQTGIDIAGSIATGALEGLASKLSEWTGGLTDFFFKPFETFSGTLAEEAFNNGKMIADKSGEGLDTSQMSFSEKFSAFMMHGFNWKEDYAAKAKETGTKATESVGSGVESGKEGLKSKVNGAVNDSLSEAKGNAQTKGKEVGDAASKGASEGIKNLSPEMAKELEAATRALQQSATNMYNGARISFTKLATVGKQAATDLYNGASKSYSSLAQSGKQSFSNLYNGGSNSIRQLSFSVQGCMSTIRSSINSLNGPVNSAIADFNRLRTALSKPIQGRVNISKTTTFSTVAKPLRARTSTYSRANSASISSGRSEKEKSQHMTTIVQLNGKELARQTAPYMNGQLKIINKRNSRLGGAY